MSKMRVFLVLAAFFGVEMKAQETKIESKLDSVLTYTRSIHSEVAEGKEPLANKTFGLEFNPARALVASVDRGRTSLTGSASLFNVNRKMEFAIPFAFERNKNHDYSYQSVDLQVRRFIGKHQNGFYFSAGTRFEHVRGHQEEGFNIFDEEEHPIISANRFGAMFGVGYRYFTQSGFYWGVSLSAGRFFTDTNKKIDADWLLSTNKLILDVELLKVGIAF